MSWVSKIFSRDQSVVKMAAQAEPDKPAAQLDTIISIENSGFGGVAGGIQRFNPDDLVGRKGLSIYSKMRIDEQVKAVVIFVRDSILSRGWCFEFDKGSPLSETEKAARIRVFEQIVCKMPGAFIDSLNVISTGRDFGFSLTEKVYTQVDIDKKTYIGLKSLLGRDPNSFNFRTDKFGELIQCEQWAAGERIAIDLEKFIHYVHNPEFDRYFGRSDLREAHRAWYMKTEFIKLWAMGLEKFAGGMLVGKLTTDSSIIQGSAQESALRDALARARSASALIAPVGVDVTVEFPSAMTGFKEAIEYHDQAIAKALLVPQQVSGHASQNQNGGNFSQASTQLESFAWRLKADADRLEACLNDQLFEDLGELNWGDGEYPTFKFKPLSTEQLRWLIATWATLITGKAVIPTEEDEKRLREILEMPARDEKSVPLQQTMNELNPPPPPAAPSQNNVTVNQADQKQSAADRNQMRREIIDELRAEFSGDLPGHEFRGNQWTNGSGGFVEHDGQKHGTVNVSKITVQKAAAELEKRGLKVQVLQPSAANGFKARYKITDKNGKTMEVGANHISDFLAHDHRTKMSITARDFAYDESQRVRDERGRWTTVGMSEALADHVEREYDGAVHGKGLPDNDATMLKVLKDIADNASQDSRLTKGIRSEAARVHRQMKDGTYRAKTDMAVTARDARLVAASARERVDFAVIDRKQLTMSQQLSADISDLVAKAVQRLLGDDENLTHLTDNDPSDIASAEFSGVDVGRIKTRIQRSLADAWAFGREQAQQELRRTGKKVLNVRDAVYFADLRDKASKFFEANSFRMAGNISDGARSVIQAELQNSVKIGRTPAQTREVIWSRLASKGFSSREAIKNIVNGGPNDAGIERALDALNLESEEAAAKYLDTLARTNLFESMNESRYAEFNDPQLGDFIVGFRYSAIMDERTTDICSELHDHVWGKDSDVWDTYRPPNHFNCRSVLVPVTQIDVQDGLWDGEDDDEPTVEPQDGFA